MEQTDETLKSLNSVFSQYDDFVLAHASDIKRSNEKITAELEKFREDYKDKYKYKCIQFEAVGKYLQQREQKIKKKETKILNEKKKLELKKRMREQLSTCKQMVTESYSSSKEPVILKREVDMLHRKRAELEEKLRAESFETLHNQIIIIEKALQVIDPEEKLKNLQNELLEKEKELQGSKGLTKAYTSKIEQNNVELQDARQVFIDEMYGSHLCGYPGIYIHRIRLLESSRFIVYHAFDLLNSLWEYRRENPNWRPFKVITSRNEKKNVVDEEDEKLVSLKKEYNETKYKILLRALNELSEYNTNAWDTVQELWCSKNNRKATTKECVQFYLKVWEDSFKEPETMKKRKTKIT